VAKLVVAPQSRGGIVERRVGPLAGVEDGEQQTLELAADPFVELVDRRRLRRGEEVQVAVETGPTGDSVSGHPHFDSLLLAGHAVAASGNIAKLVAYGGNPVALNYDQWLAFFRAAFNRMSSPGPSATERLATQNYANTSALADGWVDLAEVNVGDWPAASTRC